MSAQVQQVRDETAELIEVINGLPYDAVYIASLDWFGSVMMGKPILAVAGNDRQQDAFDALLEAGFVHGDIERGQFGYRSTFLGRQASPICRASLTEGAR